MEWDDSLHELNEPELVHVEKIEEGDDSHEKQRSIAGGLDAWCRKYGEETKCGYKCFKWRGRKLCFKKCVKTIKHECI